MATVFSRSTYSLAADRKRSWTGALAVGIAIAVAWLCWAFVARVSIYAESRSARLEVARAAHPIESVVDGQVIENRMRVGSEVQVGDVLVELDSSSARIRLAEARAHLAGIGPQLEARRRERTAEERSARADADRGPWIAREARARAAEAETSARQARDTLARSERLYAGGNTSAAEVATLRSEAQRLEQAAAAMRAALARTGDEQVTRESERRVRIEQVEREIAVLQADVQLTSATIERLANEVGRHLVRAVTAGRVAEAAVAPVGTLVRAGERLGSIVPPGAVRLVADFAPADALGRIRPGLSARLRLDGFPWTQYGAVDATVERVASELRDGRIRVELTVDVANARVPLEHGLPGVVEVELERIAPATLILRAAGHWTAPAQGQQGAD